MAYTGLQTFHLKHMIKFRVERGDILDQRGEIWATLQILTVFACTSINNDDQNNLTTKNIAYYFANKKKGRKNSANY